MSKLIDDEFFMKDTMNVSYSDYDNMTYYDSYIRISKYIYEIKKRQNQNKSKSHGVSSQVADMV